MEIGPISTSVPHTGVTYFPLNQYRPQYMEKPLILRGTSKRTQANISLRPLLYGVTFSRHPWCLGGNLSISLQTNFDIPFSGIVREYEVSKKNQKKTHFLYFLKFDVLLLIFFTERKRDALWSTSLSLSRWCQLCILKVPRLRSSISLSHSVSLEMKGASKSK